jgi:hypothetical protein
MRRLLTDLRESAVFLADLFKTVVCETARQIRPEPAAGPVEPLDRTEPWPTGLFGRRTRPPIQVQDERRIPGGAYWFR